MGLNIRRTTPDGTVAAGLVMLAIFCAGVVGWIMNIFSVFQMTMETGLGEMVVRIAGIFIPFIGAVAGYI